MTKNKYHQILVLGLLFSLFSCNPLPKDVKEALDLAGENKKELQAVLDHYQDPKDSLKLKAAYFLIGNMANKYFYPYSETQKGLISFVKQLKKENQYTEKFDSIAPYWERLKNEQRLNARPSPIMDVHFVTSTMLIENIDYSFKVWNKVPWSKKYSFEQFCEYVLPYRASNDIPCFWRKKMFKKFQWALDSIKENDFIKVSSILNDSLYYVWNKAFEEYPNMNVMDMDAVRTFVCRHHSSLKMAALRSIGIPIAEVSGLNGTSWAIVPDKQGKFWGWEDLNVPKIGAPYIDDKRFSNYTKVFQTTFKIQPFPFEGLEMSDIPPLFLDRSNKDVTREHSDAMNVKITLSIPPPKETKYAYLCFFDSRSKEWEAAHWSKIKDNQVTFNQMGLGCIYLPMYYSDGKYYPAGNPVYLNKNRTVTYLKSNTHHLESARLFRKAPLEFWENYNAEIMVTDIFEGSNDKNFKKATSICTIDKKANYFEEKTSKTTQKFRYVRYRSVPIQLKWQNEITYNKHFAELEFLGKNNQKLSGKLIANSNQNFKTCNLAFDNDIRTNFEGVYPCWIGLDLGKPTQVAKIRYMFRNSFNTIESGDQYELWYWDKEWKFLGSQIAKQHYLIFNVPKNTVLWLKNKSKGKDEIIFFMQEGKQIWG